MKSLSSYKTVKVKRLKLSLHDDSSSLGKVSFDSSTDIFKETIEHSKRYQKQAFKYMDSVYFKPFRSMEPVIIFKMT